MKVILINGKSGTGKDTVANYIKKRLSNCVVVPNAIGVKQIARYIFGVDPEEKSEVTRFTCDKITEIGYTINKYFWERIAFNSVINLSNKIVVVPDFRICNTYTFYTQEVGAEVITIRLDGENKRESKLRETPTKFDNNLGSRIKFDYIINTDENTLEETYSLIDNILYDLNMLKNNYIDY